MTSLSLRKKKSTPGPGKPVRGSRTGRPIMALLDVLGRRWALRILWELRGEDTGFRELQIRCEGMSPSVLSQRLHELNDAGVLELADGRYRLSAEGRELLEGLTPLQTWAERWARRAGKPPDAAGCESPRAGIRQASERKAKPAK